MPQSKCFKSATALIPTVMRRSKTTQQLTAFWFGNNSNKGLGIFSYSNFRFKLLDLHSPDFKNDLPIAVTGGKIDFTLFGIWANNSKDPDGS